MNTAQPKVAHYHLPGLFEFYDLYAAFLPLYRRHRAWFYDWCDIDSLYGAPADCIWGGGRVGADVCDPRKALALAQEYGISARLTFSNSLLRQEHLSDPKCNALCRLFEENAHTSNGVIVHSDRLLNHLRRNYPGLYLVSSTTKVLTDFGDLRREVSRDEFRFVVPDFRLNKSFAQLDALTQPHKAKIEFLCNECCWFGCKDRKQCYEAVSRKALGEDARSTSAAPPAAGRATVFLRRCRTPGSSASATSWNATCRWGSRTSRSKGAGWAAHWCWSSCCTTWSSRSTSCTSGRRSIWTICWICFDSGWRRGWLSCILAGVTENKTGGPTKNAGPPVLY